MSYISDLAKEAGIDLADHMGKKAWADFHINGIEKAKETIYQRIRETSRNVSKEIPSCPLSEDNVVVKIGNPVKQIVATAKEGNFDLIIMGTHGHGKMEDRIIGSTASDVIRLSYVPVTVIRLPEKVPITTHRQWHKNETFEKPIRPAGKNNERFI